MKDKLFILQIHLLSIGRQCQIIFLDLGLFTLMWKITVIETIDSTQLKHWILLWICYIINVHLWPKSSTYNKKILIFFIFYIGNRQWLYKVNLI